MGRYCKHGLFHRGPILANTHIFMFAIFMQNYILYIVNTRKFNPFEKKTTHLQYLAIDSERYCQNDEGLNNWQSASLVCFPGSWDWPIEWLIMVCQSNNSCKSLFFLFGALWYEKTKNVEQFFFPAVHFFCWRSILCKPFCLPELRNCIYVEPPSKTNHLGVLVFVILKCRPTWMVG